MHVYVYKKRDIYHKGLANLILEAEKSKMCSWQAGDSRELMVKFQSESKA